MGKYVGVDEWNIIEDGLHYGDNRIYESIMSLGNGRMGIRGNFEEDYSGDSLKGTYIAGVYYPDKTRVGWWKIGYPEYFAKVLNAMNFLGIKVSVNGQNIDLTKVKWCNFKRVLNMKHGILRRSFTIIDECGSRTDIIAERFLSMDNHEVGAISYSIKPVDKDAVISFLPYIDGDARNEDSNYEEKFWDEVDKKAGNGCGYLTMKTKKLDFYVTSAMKCSISQDGAVKEYPFENVCGDKFIGCKINVHAKKGTVTTLYKYLGVSSSRYHDKDDLSKVCMGLADSAENEGYDSLLSKHCAVWDSLWALSDIEIKGDTSAQQGIRFNIFNLNQTYTGDDPRLNIGPKGFTGEKYGGSTYWDTEAFCLPFYLSCRESSIARNLLLYRYNHLQKAKENAAKLGVKGALYPMVTMNGEECHNEWEITFEEIHRDADISYAIYNYVNYTGDEKYLADYGFEVLCEICRFWASRVNYSSRAGKYMILGVTGPNEYENNVNNNWYTNIMASWNLMYTADVAEFLRDRYPEKYDALCKKLCLDKDEIDSWKNISQKMYLPCDETLGIFLQQDGYLDKEQALVKDIPENELPINQHWSWDKILRSCFIKQGDVIHGLYNFRDNFDLNCKKRNFDFYEPRTVHESSLSACIYSIIASEIGYIDRAYDLYLRTARLDLDNINNDTRDGLHITSMAGTWLSIVHGFGGLKVKNNTLYLRPVIPKVWESITFKIMFRDHIVSVTTDKGKITIDQKGSTPLKLNVFDRVYTVPENGEKITIKA